MVKEKTKIEQREALLKQKEETDGQINDKYAKLNREIETERILKLICSNCNNPLVITAEDIDEFLTEGITNKLYVCPHCNMQNRVRIEFEGDPDFTEAKIKQTEKGLKFQHTKAIHLTEDEAISRIFYEARLVEEGRSRLNPIDRLIMKSMAIGFKRLGIKVKDFNEEKEEEK